MKDRLKANPCFVPKAASKRAKPDDRCSTAGMMRLLARSKDTGYIQALGKAASQPNRKEEQFSSINNNSQDFA